MLSVLDDGRGYDELEETAVESAMDAYWREYRRIEFAAARHKRDIGHNKEIITSLLDKKALDIDFIIARIGGFYPKREDDLKRIANE